MMQIPAFVKSRLPRSASFSLKRSASTGSTGSSSAGGSTASVHADAGGADGPAQQPKSFSRELPDSATSTQGAIRVVDVQPDYEAHMTLWTNLQERASVDDGSRRLFGTRSVDPVTGAAGDFEWVTYGEFLADFEDIDDEERALAKQHNIELFTLAEYTEMRPTDVHLSYLPLAHVFERCVHANLISSGGAIGFYQGDAAKLMDDIAALKPTVFPSVPRVLNRIFDKVRQGVKDAGGAKEFLFNKALAGKRYGLGHSGTLAHAVWDPMVFGKVKMLLGGNVRLMMNGSAPLSPDVKEFIQLVFGCPMLEGYGLTESSAVVAVSTVRVPAGNHWAAANGKSGEDAAIEALLASEELKSAILADMEAVAKEFKLFRFERNDLLTPTFKPKRNNLAKFFASEIAAMYASATAI
ncbi:hypothetical protein PybrP1_010418 [[Pythium] brassicae (nom. inval.)]|nr:hypothetical protein PybrP1_010418 [[Pythium] brassicae (nom. inval.)]